MGWCRVGSNVLNFMANNQEQIQEIKLDQLTIIELKALAYDCIARLNNEQNTLNELNNEILKRTKQ